MKRFVYRVLTCDYRIIWRSFGKTRRVILPAPILGLGMLLFFVACNKDDREVKTYYLPQEIHDYFKLPVGTVRVFRDSATGITDTVRTIESSINIWTATFGPDSDDIAWRDEKISQEDRHSYDPHIESISTEIRIRKNGEYYFIVKEHNARYGGTSDLTRIPWQVGDTIEDNWLGGKSEVVHFYSIIELAGKTYTDVYHIRRTNAASKNDANLDYYYARNKGLVVCKNYKTNRVWALQEN